MRPTRESQVYLEAGSSKLIRWGLQAPPGLASCLLSPIHQLIPYKGCILDSFCSKYIFYVLPLCKIEWSWQEVLIITPWTINHSAVERCSLYVGHNTVPGKPAQDKWLQEWWLQCKQICTQGSVSLVLTARLRGAFSNSNCEFMEPEKETSLCSAAWSMGEVEGISIFIHSFIYSSIHFSIRSKLTFCQHKPIGDRCIHNLHLYDGSFLWFLPQLSWC